MSGNNSVAQILCVVGVRPNVMKIALTGGRKAGRVPEPWDGKAAQRIKAILRQWLSGGVALDLARFAKE